MRICNKWKYLPSNYFTHTVDAILDNKKFQIPTHAAALRAVKQGQVKGHLRTRGEGNAQHCKKLNARKNRVNPGGSVTVCACIIDGELRLWHHLDKGKWNGSVAASMYRGPLLKALQKHRGVKARYLILEDYDPSGFKSRKGEVAKKEVGIRAMPFPKQRAGYANCAWSLTSPYFAHRTGKMACCEQTRELSQGSHTDTKYTLRLPSKISHACLYCSKVLCLPLKILCLPRKFHSRLRKRAASQGLLRPQRKYLRKHMQPTCNTRACNTTCNTSIFAANSFDFRATVQNVLLSLLKWPWGAESCQKGILIVNLQVKWSCCTCVVRVLHVCGMELSNELC